MVRSWSDDGVEHTGHHVVRRVSPGGNAEAASLPRLNVAPSQQETAEGKTDSLVVNREAKGNLGGPKKLKLGALH